MSDAPAKKQSPLRRSARAVALGMPLGVAAFVAGTVLNSKIAQVVLWLDEPRPWLWPLLEARLTAPILVAPCVCYLAGLVVEGPRWPIAASTVFALQASLTLTLAATVHLEVALAPRDLALAVAAGGLGVALSGWVMGLGRRRSPGPAAPPAHPASAESEPADTNAPAGDAAPKG